MLANSATLMPVTRHPTPRILAAACAILALLAASACSGGGKTTSSTDATKPVVSKPAGNSGAGSLIISKPGGFVEFDVKSGSEKPLITPADASTFLLDPAVSPDGNKLAYIVQPPPKVEGTKYDAGSDLWVANRDGSNQHVVFTHAQPNQLVRFPQWEDDGHILAVVQEISTTNGITSVVYTLERIDASSGERTNVLENVLAFALSPDGKTLTYAKLAPQSGETLESQPLAGGPGQTIVPVSENLNPFNSPRFSPDGSQIAFASADQTGARAPAGVHYITLHRDDPGAPGHAVGDSNLPHPTSNIAPDPTHPRSSDLDGLPEDIWTVAATGGSRPVRVADIKEDLPTLTWNGDGKHIFVIGSAGLYDVNVESGAVDRIGDGVFHGQIAWSP
jgi:Tol biopolymer transport system component